MKKILILSVIFGLALMVTTGTVLAKESKPKRVAENIPWNLSAAVMPVPPYGSADIVGSDTASKLTVKQAKDDKPFKIKGKMGGLTPNTTYTVYISNSYTPYVCTGWNVAGGYTMDLLYLGNHYVYALTLNQSGATVTGNLNDPYLPGDLSVNGTIDGNNIVFSVNYPTGYQGTRTFTGTIDASGFLSGSWNETGTEQGSNTWTTTTGVAVKICTGSTGWPGLLTSTIQPFTFTTNAEGKGKWKVKIQNSDIERPTGFSVWINSNGGTMLISDNGTINVGVPKPPKPPKK